MIIDSKDWIAGVHPEPTGEGITIEVRGTITVANEGIIALLDKSSIARSFTGYCVFDLVLEQREGTFTQEPKDIQISVTRTGDYAPARHVLIRHNRKDLAFINSYKNPA